MTKLRFKSIVKQEMPFLGLQNVDTINPQYSYPLTEDMLISYKLAKPSVVKCQIIAGYIERDINRRLGAIREQYFNEMVDKIIDSIF